MYIILHKFNKEESIRFYLNSQKGKLCKFIIHLFMFAGQKFLCIRVFEQNIKMYKK